MDKFPIHIAQLLATNRLTRKETTIRSLICLCNTVKKTILVVVSPVCYVHPTFCGIPTQTSVTETCPEYAMPLFLLIYLLVCHRPVHYSAPNYLPQDAI